MSDNVGQSKSLISVQTVISLAALWGVVSLIVFLLGSPISPRPAWYGIATYALENLAFLGAALLCLRNWQSPQIVSGRGVWLLFAVGMLSYFAGNLILAWWELVWNLEPDVSPADFFYLLTYLVLGIGMLLAVVSKRLNLTPVQYGIVLAIAVVGMGIAYFISSVGPAETASEPRPAQLPLQLVSAAIALESSPHGHWIAQAAPQTAPQAAPEAAPQAPPQPAPQAAPQAAPQTAPAAPTETPPPAAPAAEPPEPADGTALPPTAEPTPEAPPEVPPAPAPATDPTLEAAPEDASSAPAWVLQLNEVLAPFADPVGLLYIAGDIFLLVMATTLLLAFWGGRFSLSWRFIAAAAFSFYIADSWFAYAIARFEDYSTGELPEIFWIFSAVLFSIGAALEYSLSRRSRRGMRRRA